MTPFDAPWPVWAGLALLGAWLAADHDSLAQTWFSQPLPAAILAGVILGDPTVAVTVGLLMQLAVVGNLPVGASFRLDESSATVGVVGGAVLAGWTPPANLMTVPAWTGPAALELGWLVALTVAASLVGGWGVHAERRARLGWMLDGYRSVRDGDLARLEGLHRRCLLVTMARGALLTLFWILVSAWLWDLDAPVRLVSPLRGGLMLLPLLVPMLAVGSLVERFGPRRAWPLVTAGAVTGFLVAWLAV